MSKDIIIRQVVKGKVQNRVTIPRTLSCDYVAIKPVTLPNFHAERKKFFKK